MENYEHRIISGKKNLIITFAGSALLFGGIPPFEFLNYLGKNYTNECDLVFFIDNYQCSYHKGIKNISNNIDETAVYINDIIDSGNYDKIIFMGNSAGGYAAILFGSLCKNVSNVIAFIPQTILKNPIDLKYSNLKNFINNKTKYLIYGNKNIILKNDPVHHISHCENIDCFPNVNVIKADSCNLKELRDNGFLKKMIDNIIFG